MTAENESARRPAIQPRAFAELWTAGDAARAAKRAEQDAQAARQAEFDAGLHAHVQRVNAAMHELLELAKAESAAAGAEVEAKIAEEQAELSRKQQRELLAFVLSLLSNLPDEDDDEDADDEFELDCAD
jgi:hypothetical protein